MNEPYYILTHCHIINHSVRLNGTEYFRVEEDLSFAAFIKEVYRHTGLSYPKFFKMDNLCKLGFITSEILFQNLPELNSEPSGTGIVISNSSASLDTDIKHQNSISSAENYFPSPAVFVYTLPNIVTGEICIKNKITGENAFFIFENFDPVFLFDYTAQLLNEGVVERCLVGWVELLKENYHSFMFMAGKAGPMSKEMVPYTVQQIESIYQHI